MKPGNSSPRARRAACTVSAAALMLGVSQAATVGLHFQPDWGDNGSPGYTGFAITATAFGVSPNEWENLTPMPTGYNGGNPGPFSLSEVIDTHTSTDGLNPLPSGSLKVSWSAVAANTSGFAGSGPGYGGNHPHRGEQEVYYGFLRDDFFIYTHPESTNGYSVNIIGLKGVFTNTPYVIQLVAATDSGTSFTNAVLTAGATSQNLTYTASRPAQGIMGGVSSASTPVSEDAITIAGAPALKTDTDSWASTIAGIIITDSPVITASPVSPPAPFCEGSPATLKVSALGVPPLAFQWRKNGVPIAGATTDTYAIAGVSTTNGGYYDVTVSNAYGSATSEAAVVTGDLLGQKVTGVVPDTKPTGPAQNGRVSRAVWVASSKDPAGVTRLGVMSFSATNPGQITVPASTNLANFDAPAGTVSFWMRSTETNSYAGHQGATLFDRSVGGGLYAVLSTEGTVVVQASGGGRVTSTAVLNDGNWHHVVIAYDQSDNGVLNLYVDGAADSSNPSTPVWTWGPGQPIELGLSHDAYWEPYDGLLDDLRLYNRMLTDDEIRSLHSTDAIVDAQALQLRLNFDSAPSWGISIDWTCGLALQGAGSVNGPFASVDPATSPWVVLPDAPAQFYRTMK